MKHGESFTRLWNIWREMRHRCESRSDKDFYYYGLRGIRVCPEWKDYVNFRDWALSHGYADDLTIDRIDHNGDYEPNNCRWVTRFENCAEAGRRRKGVTKEVRFNRRVARALAMAMLTATSCEECASGMIDAFKSVALPELLKNNTGK